MENLNKLKIWLADPKKKAADGIALLKSFRPSKSKEVEFHLADKKGTFFSMLVNDLANIYRIEKQKAERLNPQGVESTPAINFNNKAEELANKEIELLAKEAELNEKEEALKNADTSTDSETTVEEDSEVITAKDEAKTTKKKA